MCYWDHGHSAPEASYYQAKRDCAERGYRLLQVQLMLISNRHVELRHCMLSINVTQHLDRAII